MITVLDAWFARGWSALDTMLDDSILYPIVRRTFATIEDARRAADALNPASFSQRHAWPNFRFIDESGSEFIYGGIDRTVISTQL